ncbi:peptidoglycan-binding protein [Anaerobranca gottschalkii]|uniref:peptidoglycan-binding protein n=1 Tax=Anaerobranca gottschalkii TaxID=108328 RepID=UPI00115FB643|nr:peptidoglycan-binding protein [Anaerobranca gottschalkii]
MGEGVQLLQRDLAQLGFNPGPIDGIFGNLTRNTVLRFQQQNNLLVDGIVGRQTKNAIRNLLKINSNNSVVYTVQRGDTLFFLAQRFNTTVSAIMEANGLSNHIIYINQKLLIPSINEISQQQQPSQTQQPQQQQQSSTQQLTRQQQMELEMLELVNQERIRHGLRPLIMDQNIVMVARLKSQDMIVNRYFAHHSPVYGSPFDMMRSFGITFRTAGENLAGSPSVIRAHTNLMNSPGHRANILNPNFTHIGIGIVEGGPYGIMFTQMFVGR